VLEKRKQLLGADHPDTLQAMANLAATYHQLGRYKKAEELQDCIKNMSEDDRSIKREKKCSFFTCLCSFV
jgi:thioredoxin-like negative regulator of GroEL